MTDPNSPVLWLESDRQQDQAEAEAVTSAFSCPTCTARAGRPCHVRDQPDRHLADAHPDRAVRAYLALAATVVCPTCRTAPGTPCSCPGRTSAARSVPGPHPLVLGVRNPHRNPLHRRRPASRRPRPRRPPTLTRNRGAAGQRQPLGVPT
ncbi:hypothetical protein ACODT5_28595 [Streptomyces sp. 5.8]|uniref:zinc finger domain-containing protein n=1 Tax=Streptomyces sp. 5.8 TaxID=3406571 RepID=UPI003BB64899